MEPSHSVGFSQGPTFYSYKMVALTLGVNFNGVICINMYLYVLDIVNIDKSTCNWGWFLGFGDYNRSKMGSHSNLWLLCENWGFRVYICSFLGVNIEEETRLGTTWRLSMLSATSWIAGP